MIEQFWIFHCGWFRIPRGAFEKGGGIELAKMPFLSALAYHSELGPIIIDAPFGREGPANAGEVFGSFMRKAGQKFRPQWGIVPRLEELGFRSSEVDHILMTHLHWDHTGGMKELAHARFTISRREWEHAVAMGPVEAVRSGYVQGDFRALESRVEQIDVPPSFDPSEGVDLFGDGSIQAVDLPGHSVGHIGYRFRLTDGRTIFFAGDAAFTVPHVTDGRQLGIFPRLAAHDIEQARTTLQRLREWWRRSAATEILVTSHDIDWGERCMGAPAPLHLG